MIFEALLATGLYAVMAGFFRRVHADVAELDDVPENEPDEMPPTCEEGESH